MPSIENVCHIKCFFVGRARDLQGLYHDLSLHRGLYVPPTLSPAPGPCYRESDSTGSHLVWRDACVLGGWPDNSHPYRNKAINCPNGGPAQPCCVCSVRGEIGPPCCPLRPVTQRHPAGVILRGRKGLRMRSIKVPNGSKTKENWAQIEHLLRVSFSNPGKSFT